MSWDDKGWHEYKKAKRNYKSRTKAVCEVCDYPFSVHLSKVDYVTHRLLHGKTNDQWHVTDITNDFINATVTDNLFKSSPFFFRLRKP